MTDRHALSVAEAAHAIGISTAFAYQLVHRGELPHVKFGRRTLIPVLELERYLSEHLVAS